MMGGVPEVLFVEDDAPLRFGVSRHLERHGFRVVQVASCEAARERFRASHPDAVLTDFRLPDGEALELIADFRRERPFLPIVVLTGYGTIDIAVQVVRRGAQNLLTKPINLDVLVEELKNAFVRPTPRGSEPPKPQGGPLRSETMLAFREEMDRLRDVDCSILISGETGTGKTMLARWLHDAGRRRAKSFVDLNCAGLGKDLVEAELFGHERGAFTSAHAAKPGLFELADGGTLFLDEIGDIDIAVQPKVLKAIEEKRFRRVGGLREQSVDVRIIAASHRDLRAAVKAGAMRPDLYYRLSTVTIAVPSLRERREDIPLIAREILDQMAARLGREALELTPDAQHALSTHPWPGNVRELKNVLERAVHLTLGRTLTVRDLRIELPVDIAALATPSSVTLREVERERIEQALALHGHVGEAARSLGISRSSLYAKAKAYGILPGRGSTGKIRLPLGSDS